MDTRLTSVAEPVARRRGRRSPMPMPTPIWIELRMALLATWAAGAANTGSTFRTGTR